MDEPVFVRDMEKNYFILNREKDRPVGFQQKMLFHNNIDGLLRVEIRNINNEQQYYYDVTSLKSISAYFEHKKVKAEDIEFIYINIMSGILNAKKYLLSEDSFVLGQETIFIGEEDTCLKLCYKEDYHVDIREQLVRVTEYFLDKIDYNDEKVILYIYGVYKVLREENCTFQKIEEVFHKYSQTSSGKEREVKELSVPFPEVKYIEQPPQEYNNTGELFEGKKKKVFQKKNIYLAILIVCDIICILVAANMGILDNPITRTWDIKRIGIGMLILVILNYSVICYCKGKSEEEFVLDENFEEETKTVLLASLKEIYKIQSFETGLKISFCEEDLPITVGKSQSLQKGRIENSIISNQHCIISMDSKQFTIADLNSTNGTFLNEVKLESHKVYGLEINDKIRLGSIEFSFLKEV